MKNVLVRGHVEIEIKRSSCDEAQPLVDELLHEVAPNSAFPLASNAKSCDCVLSLSYEHSLALDDFASRTTLDILTTHVTVRSCRRAIASSRTSHHPEIATACLTTPI